MGQEINDTQKGLDNWIEGICNHTSALEQANKGNYLTALKLAERAIQNLNSAKSNWHNNASIYSDLNKVRALEKKLQSQTRSDRDELFIDSKTTEKDDNIYVVVGPSLKRVFISDNNNVESVLKEYSGLDKIKVEHLLNLRSNLRCDYGKAIFYISDGVPLKEIPAGFKQHKIKKEELSDYLIKTE